MKKERKLRLSRETLRNLKTEEMARVAGGECSELCIALEPCPTNDGGCTLPPSACFATCSCSI